MNKSRHQIGSNSLSLNQYLGALAQEATEETLSNTKPEYMW